MAILTKTVAFPSFTFEQLQLFYFFFGGGGEFKSLCEDCVENLC